MFQNGFNFKLENAVQKLKEHDKTISEGVANKSKKLELTLLAASWQGTASPYTYTLAVEGATADNNIDIGLDEAATKEQYEAMGAAMLHGVGQGKDYVTIKAFGDKPTVDIPLNVTVRGD